MRWHRTITTMSEELGPSAPLSNAEIRRICSAWGDDNEVADLEYLERITPELALGLVRSEESASRRAKTYAEFIRKVGHDPDKVLPCLSGQLPNSWAGVMVSRTTICWAGCVHVHLSGVAPGRSTWGTSKGASWPNPQNPNHPGLLGSVYRSPSQPADLPPFRLTSPGPT